MFWLAIAIFFLGNGLLAWEAMMKKKDPYDLPRIFTSGVFRLLTTIGGIGWIGVPVMFYGKFGFVGAGLGWLAFFLSGAVIALAIRGLIESSADAL